MQELTIRPRIGITWGSKSDPVSLGKLALYAKHVRAAGGEPVALLPLTSIGDVVEYLMKHDAGFFQLHAGEGASVRDFAGLLFAGGPDVDPVHYGETHATPTLEIDGPRDGFELPLIKAAIAHGVPVFGICRGMQLLNIALGGQLYQDVPTQHPGALEHRQGAFHEVHIESGSRLAELAGEPVIKLNSWHHQGVKLPAGLANGLVPTAFSPDGIVEAVEVVSERSTAYVMGVQWHPERHSPDDSPAATALSDALFADFVRACNGALTQVAG